MNQAITYSCVRYDTTITVSLDAGSSPATFESAHHVISMPFSGTKEYNNIFDMSNPTYVQHSREDDVLQLH